MNKLKKISDKLDVKELLEVKGGGKERHICIFASAVRCNTGATKDDNEAQK